MTPRTATRVVIGTPVALVTVLVAAAIGRVIGEVAYQARFVDDLTGPEGADQ